MLPPPPPPLRLTIDLDAVAANWRDMARRSAPAAAVVKADAYGMGAREVAARLAAEGCRDLFVATWAEAAALLPLGPGLRLHVLHGLFADEIAFAAASGCVPVINTPESARLWRDAAPGRPCDLMVDTGISRLGLTPAEAAEIAPALTIDVAMSHLACADEPGHAMNAAQLAAFAALALPAARRSLANSAGVLLGRDYAFDLTRPGLALYGGALGPGHTARAVATLEARIVQTREIAAGASVGYNATWSAPRPARLAVLNIGYADGLLRAFGHGGQAVAGGERCPVAGRVSMDLLTIDVTGAPAARAGDWASIEYDLAAVAAASGLSQYELLTTLGRRFERRHIGRAAAASLAA